MLQIMTEGTGKNRLAPPDYDAVIVGGGMIGLTLATALGGTGLRIAVIDRDEPARAAASAYDGRSSAVAYASQRMLAAIGAWDGMRRAAEPILDIRVSDGDSLLFLHYDHRDLAGGAGGDAPPFGHIVENRAIRQALFGRVADLDTVDHLAPAVVVRIEREAGRAVVILRDGRRLSTALIVAADGRNSALRREAGIPVTHWTYPQTGIVCTVAHESPHRGVAHERFLPAGPLAFLPMTDDPRGIHRSSVVWTERNALAKAMMALDDPGFSAELARRFGPSLGEIRVLGGRWAYPLSLLHAARYTDRRLVLVGDAAHAIHPIAGQGLNLGLRDVAALAETLVDAHRLGLDIGDGQALARYQRWRRVDNFVLMAVTDGLNRLFSNAIPPVRLARDIGLATVNRALPVKRFLMRHAMGTVGRLPRLLQGHAL